MTSDRVLPKFSLGAEAPEPYDAPHVFERIRTKGVERLIIAPRGDHIDLMMDLGRVLPEPFGILYVLVVSRSDRPPARYQSASPSSRDEMETFLSEFREFFEGDGRHHLWVTSLESNATLVYDRHELIYAYGPLDAFEQVLRSRGLGAGHVPPPQTHQHSYNAKYDKEEDRIMKYWSWIPFPLQPSDE
jgi:hypothetical protein